MKEVYVIYAKRTPMGKIGGVLSDVRPDDLLAGLFKDCLSQIKFDPKLIDDVISGCANQAGEDNRNVSRMAAILAGIPFDVPAVTVNRLCASSLDAIGDAFARIRSGLAEVILVGGVESMTRGPLVISKGSQAYGRDSKMYDTTFGWRFPNSKMEAMFPLLGMGETAEEVAGQLKISREDQDQFAFNSHQKAINAQKSAAFDSELLPVTIEQKKSTIVINKDECPRIDTNLDQLSALKPVFKKGGSVTAGNSSPMNDGAAALMLVSEQFLKDHKLAPLARITGFATRGIHPSIMGLGPVESTKILLKKWQKNIKDFNAIELNEAFAAQSIGCIRQLGLDESRINLNGGAIALGHPLGCSGARITTTLIHLLQKRTLSQGLASMCVGVGQGVSLSLERC